MPTPTIITLEPILPVQIVAKAFPELLAGDVDVSVNGTLYDSETAPVAVNIPVTNLNDDSVGVVTPGVGVKVGNSLVLIKKTGGALVEAKAVVAEGEAETTIDDSVVVIKDSGGVTLYAKSVKADDVAEQVVNDATVNVRKSDGVLIAAVPVKAQATQPYNVANSTVTMKDTAGATLDSKSVKATESEEFTAPNATAPIKDSAGALLKTEVFKSGETRDVGIADSTITNAAISPTYSQLVKATEGLILPTQSIENNGVASGSILSVGTINVTTNVPPTSFNVSGRNIDIVVPSGGGSYDLDLVDRFGNAFPTKQVTANATWDLRTLTPYDWADLYLNELTASYSSTITNAVIQLVTDLHNAGVFQLRTNIYPYLGGNAVDNSLNLRYPFKNFQSGQLKFIGSPTHNSNGVTIVTGSVIIANSCPDNYAPYDLNVFHYSRTNNQRAGNPADWCAQGFGIDRHYLIMRGDSSNNTYIAIGNGTGFLTTANSDGGFHFNGGFGAGVAKLVRNGTTVLASLTDGGGNLNARCFTMGGTFENNFPAQPSLRNYAAWAIGRRLTDTQMADEYTAWQNFQTSLGRQI